MGFGFGSGNNVSYSHGSRSFGLIETTCPGLYKNFCPAEGSIRNIITRNKHTPWPVHLGWLILYYTYIYYKYNNKMVASPPLYRPGGLWVGLGILFLIAMHIDPLAGQKNFPRFTLVGGSPMERRFSE